MSRPTPPVAAKVPKHITQLGRERVDDYAWIRDDNWQAVFDQVPERDHAPM